MSFRESYWAPGDQTERVCPYGSELRKTECPALIILDANIIKGTSLRSSVADVLRAIRAAGVERVATPWIAVEEVAAQQVLAYQAKHDAATKAVDELRKATPWDHVASPRRWPDEHVREHWRERYASITEVMETSPTAYQQALYREANLIEPCKTVNSGRYKTGARDAAIWLTAVEYAREHPEENVYFVSNDADHSSNGKFPEPMQRDIAGMEDRFFLFTSLDGVVNKFATEVEASAEDVLELLDTEETRAAVLDAARASTKRYRMIRGVRLIQDGDSCGLRQIGMSRWAPTAVALDKVLEVSGREVGGHHWFTVWVRWLLRENKPVRGDEGQRAYAWETRVLLSTAADQAVTVLDSRRPGPITEEDIPGLPELPLEAERLRLLGEAHVRALLNTPAMQATLASIAERVAPDLSPLEAAMRKAISEIQVGSDWRNQIAEPLRDLPIEAPGDEEYGPSHS